MKGLSKAQSSLESESGAHIQIPGVADYPTQSTNRAAESGGKERISDGPAGIREGRGQCSLRWIMQGEEAGVGEAAPGPPACSWPGCRGTGSLPAEPAKQLSLVGD